MFFRETRMYRAESISGVAYDRKAKQNQPHLGATDAPTVICSHVDAGVKGDAVRRGIKLLETIFPDSRSPRHERVVLGRHHLGSPERSASTLALRHAGAIRAIFSFQNELCLGEAYIYDDCDIEDDVEAACNLELRTSSRN